MQFDSVPLRLSLSLSLSISICHGCVRHSAQDFNPLVACFMLGSRWNGQVRWPKGPPHLALNPPYFLVFCLFHFRRKTCFPPKKGIFCSFFSVSLCFFLVLTPRPFHSLFLCLVFFFFFFRPSFCFLVFVSLFLSLCFGFVS